MSINRFLPRNFSFYAATNPDEALGGLAQNGAIIEANFLDILGILLVVDGSVTVQERIWSQIVSKTGVPLETGVYDIHSDGMCYMSPIHWAAQLVILSSSIQVGGEAWIHRMNSHNVTDMQDAAGSSKINSSQNGLLLRSDIHKMFDQYLVSVNPDDGYKVVVFTIDRSGIDGRILDPVCRSPTDPHHVSDQLLRWHFRQSVLADMRGAGEPVFEDHSQSGTDMEGEILVGRYSHKRSECEIPERVGEVS
ncbi:hypothetical protein HOY80DRAFT_1139044 [Tuber brumale]|nr:hypothetical protein HOY80DRAFT_1139044 [Tuber brumale]